jgi:hypothetical protein
MESTFEYGFCKINDLTVLPTSSGVFDRKLSRVRIQDRKVRASNRFWTSLHRRFGFTENIFKWFKPLEVFQRISEIASNDEVRWCIEHRKKTEPVLLAVSNPTSSIIRYENLRELLDEHDGESVAYCNGIVTSHHRLRNESDFKIAGDSFENRYVLETPIDGFGRPSVFLSLIRLRCTNGAIAHTPAFRSELTLGKGDDRGEFAIERVMREFSNSEGFTGQKIKEAGLYSTRLLRMERA